MAGLLIRGGTLVTARKHVRGDVRCADGKIVEIGRDLEPVAGGSEEILDADGALVFPGGVDPHVHLALPVAGTVSSDDFLTGSRAALAGGTTTLIDFVHPERGQDLIEALQARKEEAAESVLDHAFHMAVTWWGDGVAEGMRRCVREEGVPSFKAYMAYLDTVGLPVDDLREVLRQVAALDARILLHCEEGERVERLRDELFAAGRTGPEAHPLSRPPATEGDAVAVAARLAAQTEALVYIVHVTCREALTSLQTAQDADIPMAGETCTHYLTLDDSVFRGKGFERAKYVLSPPLRPKEHQDALWDGLRHDSLQVVSTDHCPFNLAGQKELGREDFRKIPNGAAGIEHRLALLYTHGVRAGRLSMERFVDLVSTTPARLFGLHPRKGSLEPGADADLVVWDPERTGRISARTHHHRCDSSIYEGFETHGAPAAVVTGGAVSYRDGELRREPGAGRFLRREL